MVALYLGRGLVVAHPDVVVMRRGRRPWPLRGDLMGVSQPPRCAADPCVRYRAGDRSHPVSGLSGSWSYRLQPPDGTRGAHPHALP